MARMLPVNDGPKKELSKRDVGTQQTCAEQWVQVCHTDALVVPLLLGHQLHETSLVGLTQAGSTRAAIATVHRSVLCHLRLVLLSQLRVDLSAARRELTVNSRLANVLLARRITPLIVLTISNGKLLAHTIPSFLLYQLILFGTCELSIRAVCALWTSVVSTFSEIKAVWEGIGVLVQH